MRARIPAALLVLALASGVAACGDDSGSTSTTTAPRPTTLTVAGLGFRATLPATWSDITDQIQTPDEDTTRIDVAFGDRTATGYKPTVIVSHDRGGDVSRSPLATIERTIRRSEATPGGPRPGPAAPTKVAGIAALETTLRGRQDGQELQKRRIITRRGGTLYTISFSSAVGDAKADAVLAGLLSSWHWHD